MRCDELSPLFMGSTVRCRAHSKTNEQVACKLGVKRVTLPQPGAKCGRRKRQYAQRRFRVALRFRAGIEGRISHLHKVVKVFGWKLANKKHPKDFLPDAIFDTPWLFTCPDSLALFVWHNVLDLPHH